MGVFADIFSTEQSAAINLQVGAKKKKKPAVVSELLSVTGSLEIKHDISDVALRQQSSSADIYLVQSKAPKSVSLRLVGARKTAKLQD